MKPTLLILLLTAGVLYSNIGKAGEPVQSHSSIRQAAQLFLANHQNIQPHSEKEIHIGHLDPRLSLRQCDSQLDTFLAPGGKLVGKTTVGVRCSAPRPWAIYVPATVKLYARVYQTINPLPKGHIISEHDISPVKYNLARLHRGYYTDKTDILGKQTRRNLPAHKVLSPGQIRTPLLVKRGEQVALIAKSRQFAIRMQGKAMMDGAKGDRIRVKNLSSKRIIEGVVTRHGEVAVLN